MNRATPEAGKAPADTSGTGALPAIASPRSDVPKATAAVPSPAPTGLLPPYRNADQDVRYGVRVAAGYAWRLIAITIAVYGIFIFLGRIQLVGIAVFVGLVISALLRPVADRLELVLPRALAVAVAVLTGVVFVAGVFAFIATSVAGQSATLSAQLSNGVNEIDQWLRRGPLHLSSSQLSGAVDQARLWISGHQAALIGQALGQASFALEVLTGFALAVFCSIFFIHSGDRMWAWFLRETPPTMRAKIDIAGRAAWETFAGYTRGIVIVAATNALLVCLALLGLRVPLALPLALLVFFATFIPIIGAPIALAVATVVALAGRGPLVALLVLVLIAVIGQIDGHVLQPLVMSRAVAIHPIVVALAVGCGTVLAGLVGAIIAVPLVSVAWAVNRKLRPIED